MTLKKIIFSLLFTVAVFGVKPKNELYAQGASREYQIKAAFLYNFSQFVNWPASSFQNTSGQLVIGVVGENPFGSVLKQIAEGETVNGKKIQVKYFASEKEITACQILFIPENQKLGAETIKTLKLNNTLLVGEKDSFLADGGMIRFYTASNKLKFEVHLSRVQETEFKMSSKLLKMATLY